MVDVYRPVVEAGTRRIMTQSGEADETIIDRMAAGGGVVGGGSSRMRGNEAETVELTFQIDSFSSRTERSLDPIPTAMP
jgi:hypothetical protein